MEDNERRRKPKEPVHPLRPAARASAASVAGLGIQLAVSILLFLYLGQWLDKKLGTAPWLLIAGVFVGAGIGFYNLYHVLTAGQRDQGRRPGGQGRGRERGER